MDLLTIFGESFDTVLYKNSARIAFDRSETYGSMPNHHEQLIEFMTVDSYKSEETVIDAKIP